MSKTKKQSWNMNGPVTAAWLRSLGLDAFKSDGKYPNNRVNLLIETKTGLRKDEFWVLEFQHDDKKGDWFVSLSAHRGHQYLTSFFPARVKTREDVWRLFTALELPPAEPKE